MNQTEQGVRRSMVGCDTPYAHWLVLGSVHNVTPERWRGGAEAICSPWPDTTEAYYAFSHISGGSVHCAVELTR